MKVSNLKDRTDLGTIIAFAGHDLPDGYLYCDGSTYDIVDQLPLFLTIGLSYGGYLSATPQELPWFDCDSVTVVQKATDTIIVDIHRDRGLMGLYNVGSASVFTASLNGTDATSTTYNEQEMGTGRISLENTGDWSNESWYASMPSSGVWTATGLFSIRNDGGSMNNSGWSGFFQVPDLNNAVGGATLAGHNSYGISTNIGYNTVRGCIVGNNNHAAYGLSVATSGSASLTPNGTINANHNVNTRPNASCSLQQITHTTAMMGAHQHPFLCGYIQHGLRMTQGANANRNENKVTVRRNSNNNQADQTHATGAVGSNNNNKHNHTVGVTTSGNINVTITPGSWSGNLDGNLDASTVTPTVSVKNKQFAVKYLIKSSSTENLTLSSQNGLIRQGLTLNLDAGLGVSGTTWADQSVNDYDAILENGPVRSSTNPKYFTFDGVDDRAYVKTKKYEVGDLIREMSVFAWIRTSYNGGTPGVWANNNWSILDYDRSEYFSFAINDSGEVQMNGGTNSVGNITGASANFDLLSSATVNDGNWHYVGWTFSVSKQQIVFYIDGAVDRTLTADGTMTPLGDGATFTRYGIIGDGSEADTEGGAGNSLYFEGDISQIHFYDGESLTAAQVLHNFNYRKSAYGF